MPASAVNTMQGLSNQNAIPWFPFFCKLLY